MAKRERNQLLFGIKVVLIGASLPLLLSHQSWATDCTKTEINSNIEQFKDVKKAKTAFNAVVKCGEKAIASLELALSDDKPAIRANAASALGKLGVTAQNVAPILVKALEDSEETVRMEAFSALIQIGREAKNQPDSQLKWWDLISAIEDLEALKKSLEEALARLEKDETKWVGKEKKIEELRLLTRVGLSTKLEHLTNRFFYQVVQLIKENPLVWLAVGYLIVYLGVFIIRPTWLLKLDELVKPAELKIPVVNLPVSLRYLLFLKYHPRVLDAWVKNKLGEAEQVFQNKSTVREREIHIPVPVTLDGQTISELSGQDLQSTFQEKRVCLLISGEGGAGKTSLACQIAKWGMGDDSAQRLCEYRMLPVLIEQELESQDLIEAIRGQLRDLINAVKPISEELLDNLLRQRRLLVIVDHLSEMSEETRKKIQPNSAKFPVNALIVTSRLEEKLGGVNKTILKPLRVEGNRLSKFMDAYLDKKGKRDLFDDEEYFDACRRLSRMVGERNITVLLARMFADQLIEDIEGTLGDNLPENIPALMLSYLNKLNRTVEKVNQRNELLVHKDAQVVAWECLKQTYQPGRARREDVVTALVASLKATEDTEARKKEAETILQYLKERLRLIKIFEPGDKIRFVLDPLAEYMAALCLVDYCCDSEEKWKKFLTSVDAVQGSLDAIQGFLLAVRDCCLVKRKELNIPDFVAEELGRKGGLDPEAIQAAQRKQRVRKLIEELDAPETEYRLRAVTDLGAMGKDANIAISRLVRLLVRESEVVEIRLEALKSLKQLEAKDSLLPVLSRRLEKESEEVKIRLEAFKALKKFGIDDSGIPIVKINANADDGLILLIEPPPTETINLVNGVILEMVCIPGGSFMMGTEEEEIKRLNQKYNSDWFSPEKPIHEVKIQPFFIGKFQVTQAQWKAIASLPKVKVDLEPDPSSFKGDDLPVETISWEEAVEFCQRLSTATGKEYRLPTEAEWEYACRAGTTTPFHFGETITGELANYTARQTYANEPTGEYREETTPVGSFPPNAFGLYDLHGNVWEWCKDNWHYNYEDAPTDGSAWTSGNSSRKVIRGGSWLNNPDNCRSAYRNDLTRDKRSGRLGFRVVCVAPRTT